MTKRRALEIHREEYMIFRSNDVDIVMPPVSPYSAGQGLPYAPSDWPNKGDVWLWKVGKRVSRGGFFADRYLYLPKRLRQRQKPHFFPSRLSIERFVKRELNEDSTKFFQSFSWNIPFKKSSHTEDPPLLLGPAEEKEESPAAIGCGAGNNNCVSMMEGKCGVMSCDICCSEPGFCRDCCCILCSKVVESTHGSYSFIRCQAKVSGDSICGHVAHIDCALRAYLAGTVGGSLGLDVEYYCRRCDTTTPLISHVQKLLDLCRAVEAREDIVKILTLGARILFGSHNLCPKLLHGHIESALTKLKSGLSLRHMWEEFDKVLTATTEEKNKKGGGGAGRGIGWEEVEEVLQELKKSQEEEYKLAETKLGMQHSYVTLLREQLETAQRSSSHPKRRRRLIGAAAGGGVEGMVQRLTSELSRFENMKRVRKGFRHLSSTILKTHFGISLHDDDDVILTG